MDVNGAGQVIISLHTAYEKGSDQLQNKANGWGSSGGE